MFVNKSHSQVLGIVNVITINVSASHTGATSFFNWALGIGWWFTLVMLILYLFHVVEKFYTLPWLPIEIGALCIITLMYFIASLMVILISSVAHTIAGVFGFVTMGVYAYSGYLKFTAWKNGELAQGTLSRSTTTTTSSMPASAFPA